MLYHSASSTGVNYDSKKYSKGDPNYKNQGLTPNNGVTVNGNADSTTKSAIANGKIIVKSNPNQDLSGLNRNTTSALNALGKIFDKKTVQEQQELANLFGQEAFKAVGDLGLKEGSPEKAALDTFVGGVMSKMGGSNFASGAAGAGINQLVMNELKNIKDPAVLQWASAIVGAVAAKVIGGNAKTGASVAASATKNNYLNHMQMLDFSLTKEQRDLMAKRQDVLMGADIQGEEGGVAIADALTPDARANDEKYPTEVQDALAQRSAMLELANSAYVAGKLDLNERNSIVERMNDESIKIRDGADSFVGIVSTAIPLAIYNVPLAIVADNAINPSVIDRGDLSSIALQKVFDPANEDEILHMVALRGETDYVPSSATLITPDDNGYLGAAVVLLGVTKGKVFNVGRLIGKEAVEAAENMGFQKIGQRSHGQPVFKSGNKYITPDVDGHNGGVWKMADSVKNLGSKETRMGTYDANLNRIGD